jgi:hypothetical protein
MTVKSILLICALVTTLCFQESNAQSTGDDLDPNKCIRSAGYVWSAIKKDCIRAFELETQLVNKENIFFASILFSASADSVEVFSKEGQFLLMKKKKNYYIGNNDDVSYFIEKNNSKWLMGKYETDEILYTEK